MADIYMTEAPGISVLHVDDDPAFADLTAEMLSEHKAQFTVETAINASEGRDRLATNSFDCIVSDYEMPSQNGIEFLETVREKYPDLPFILYTGKGSETVASDAIAAGVTDYLQKESGTSQYTVLANKIRNAVERYRQQERAKATRNRLRQIIDLLPQFVFVKDETGEFLLANEATAEAYGTTVGNLEGATDADFADSKADIEQFRADDQAVIESGEPKYIPEESLTTADGETRLLETTKIPYDPVETDGDAVLGVSMDITERRERETMLQQYQYAYESALSGIAQVDLDGDLMDVNPAFLDMWGYDDEDDVIGRSAIDLWEDPEQARAVLETVKEQGRWEGELEAVRADESTFYARGVNSHLTDSDGTPIGVVSSFFDITERKEREREIQKLTERLDLAVEGANLGIWDWDMTTDEVEFNEQWAEMLGYSLDEIEPRLEAWETRVHPDDLDDVKEALESHITGDAEYYDTEQRMQTADGDYRWIRDIGQVVERGEDGEPARAVGIHLDIDDRKTYEQQLKDERDMFTQGPAVVFKWREAEGWPVEHVSENVEDVLGYTAEQFQSGAVAYADVIHDQDRERVFEEVAEHSDGETDQFSHEPYRIVTPDGTVRWVLDHTKNIRKDGEITHRLGYLVDITERKEREQELRRTNTVLRTIVENLPMGVLVEDAERDILIANDLLGETFGRPIDGDKITGRDCAATAEELKDLFADPEGFIEGVTERIERREPVQNEELPLADGRVLERDYVPYTLPEGEAHLWLYRDVTERKQRKQELDRSRQFLQETQEVAHIGGWEYNVQSKSLRWSDEVYRIHGLPPDADVTVEDAIEFYHPDDRDTIREAVDRLVSEGEPYDVELRIVTVGDDVRWVRALGEPVYEDSELIAVQGTFQDITERKEREQELQIVRERFERFASNVEDAFFLLPTDYSETEYANPAVERIYGVTPEEAYDDPTAWLRHVHAEDKDELLADMEAQQDGTTGWPIEQEFRIDHPDRGMRWVQARLDVITDENGDPSQLTGVTTDITEQIEHEQQLEQKTEELEQLATKYESQYRTLFEEAPVMMVLTRSEDGRPIIEDCNSQFAETLGYDADTIIDSGLAEFYTPESAERLQSQGYSRALNGQFTRERRDLLAIDGEVIEALLRAVPRRTADGEVIGTVAMYIDITERESVKRTNERLEEFTSIVSHDLRNPLNVATGRLELAAEECDSAHLDDLEGALNRMGTLIDDLLTLAREGKAVTDAQPVHLATIVDECWENVETNQAKLITNTDRGVQADRSRLKQVFENLFRNAVEHGREDVTVTIGELDDGFYIEDDGPGIPSDERDAVFEAGYSKSTDGTGFGLSIVEQIVTAHDWHVRVTEGADGGARFEITNVEFVDAQTSALNRYQVEDN